MNIKNESLLLVGIGAISTGVERLDVNIWMGLLFIAVGAGIIYLRGHLKVK